MLDDILQLLQAAGVGVIGKTLFKGSFNGVKNYGVCVNQYGGQPPELSGDVQLEHPGLQIKVRDKQYANGEKTCLDIQNILHAVRNERVGGSYYTAIRANQSAYPLGQTPNNEFEFVQNFTVGMHRL